MKVFAPFTPDQVASLNGYQASGRFAEFTCGNGQCPGDQAVLVAAEDGWHCPSCSYTQDWAHQPMADGTWRRHMAHAVVTVDGGEPVKATIGTVDLCAGKAVPSSGGTGPRDFSEQVHGHFSGPREVTPEPVPLIEARIWLAPSEDSKVSVTDVHAAIAELLGRLGVDMASCWHEAQRRGEPKMIASGTTAVRL